MLALNSNDSEFQLIHRYISNSYKTKNKFVKNIFALERKGILKKKMVAIRIL